MILFNDEIHMVSKELERECYEKDHEETNVINMQQLKELLESVIYIK